ncbi:MAG: DUF362 domain-containing protein [Candidatus Margulisiibacteriota bacterium]|nr:DUF362 domain-containing protein [Candidatus Margulisiibacteriota bacterium]
MKSQVAIVECPDYNQDKVDAAVKDGLQLIGGLDKFIKPGQKVLLKVNALMDSFPEAAATTHPALVSALTKEIGKIGASAFVGDSPGNASANIAKTMEKAGFTKAVEEAGGGILNFQRAKIVDIKSPSNNKRIKKVKICQAVLDADVIINLPKLKTHGWTLFTGAIKNMFGIVPGFFKSKYHIIAPQPHEFSESLVDILEVTKPTLNIMDGIIGMEGPGPSSGQPRSMGALFFSEDAVAMDAVCSEAINYRPFDIDTTKIAHRRGLGTGDLKEIEIVGSPLEAIKKSDWKHASNTYSLTKRIPSWLNWIFRPVTKLLRIDPVIDQEKCEKCLICVENCPAKTIHFENNIVKIDLKNCIMCYCCSELCPYKAIKLKRSWLTKKMGFPAPE